MISFFPLSLLFLLPSPPSLPLPFLPWYVAQTALEFLILLPPPQCWNSRHAPLCPSCRLFVRVIHKDSPSWGSLPAPQREPSHLHACAPSSLSSSVSPPPGSLLCLPFATGMRPREGKTFTQGHTAEEIRRMSRKKAWGKEGEVRRPEMNPQVKEGKSTRFSTDSSTS